MPSAVRFSIFVFKNGDTDLTKADDWTSSRTWHIDIWTGNSNNDGQPQIECENALTPDADQSIVRNPPAGLDVDCKTLGRTNSRNSVVLTFFLAVSPTWSNGQCHTEHTYNNADASKACSGGSGGGGSGSCSWDGHCAGKWMPRYCIDMAR